jgi:hypothetical protein
MVIVITMIAAASFLLGPFDLENKMTVTVIVDAQYGTLSVIFILKVNKRESSRLLRISVLGKENAVHFAERLEQLH